MPGYTVQLMKDIRGLLNNGFSGDPDDLLSPREILDGINTVLDGIDIVDYDADPATTAPDSVGKREQALAAARKYVASLKPGQYERSANRTVLDEELKVARFLLEEEK